jgi:carbonic anhydrase
MEDVGEKRADFVRGLVEHAGWDEARAGEHFDELAPLHQVHDAVAFVIAETKRLRALYPTVLIAPLLYRVEDDRLLQIVEG